MFNKLVWETAWAYHRIGSVVAGTAGLTVAGIGSSASGEQALRPHVIKSMTYQVRWAMANFTRQTLSALHSIAAVELECD